MTDATPLAPARPTLLVSEIGEFVRFNSCLRRAKLGFGSRTEARRLPFYSRLENTLDVVLRDRGLTIEGAWERQLEAQGYTSLGQGTRERPFTFDELLQAFERQPPGSLVFGREISLSGSVGAFIVEGRMDFVVLLWRNNRPVIRIVEGKASRRDKTYQRMQVATYVALAKQELMQIDRTIGGAIISSDHLEAIVARVDEDLREPQDILETPPLDLTTFLDDLHQLLEAGGPLDTAAANQLDALPFRLEAKCDNCVFNVACFPEAGRQRLIELLSVSQPAGRALRAAGLLTIDDLAELDPQGPVAAQLRANDGVDEDPLRLIAKATARRKMLPGGQNVDGFAVAGLPMAGLSQCPSRQIDGHRLVRIYINVDYDYVEDRIASVTAYVVSSDNVIRTPFGQTDAGFRPSPGSFEVAADSDNLLALSGRKVSQFKSTAWTGSPAEDGAAERQMLESFFQQLVEAIADVAGADVAPIHFYVWSPSEMTRLMEGCARGGASLIRHLSELLGCRQGKEQLIYTSLQAEVNRRFGLGWTGRGLSVATGLTWFGRRFHWQRLVRGTATELDRVFHQDIFDFASTLLVRDGEWGREGDPVASNQRFEIRSRFNDSLSMPYYAVAWGQLNSADPRWNDEPLVRAAIRRYESIRAQPGLLRSYLEARCEALRFIEEQCSTNARIEKIPLELGQLGTFGLGVDSPRAAAIDVLRIDWQVKYNEWLSAQYLTSGERISAGRCLPLSNVRHTGGDTLAATIDPSSCNLSLDALARRYSEGEGSFIRLLPWSGDPSDPAETNGGITCILEDINWQQGSVRLTAMRPVRAAHYRLFNAPIENRAFAILDQSATDFVAPKVESRLRDNLGQHVDRWFDLSAPVVTAAAQPDAERLVLVRAALDAWRIPGRPDAGLLDEQANAAVRGATARIQALQGPPGTGKTATTAAAIFARAAASLSPGDVVVLAGPTHRAVDTIIERFASWEPSLRAAFDSTGVAPPPFRMIRLDPKEGETDLPATVECVGIPAQVGPAGALINNPTAVTIVTGTVNALLKFESALGARRALNAALLVVDEASMMVFPHLLALASLTQNDARIMLAGDNRQLAPILSHAWDKEDRPPTVQFQPFLSAYEVAARVSEAVSARPNADELVVVDRLRHTFRLPPAQRALIANLYRAQDGFELEGRTQHPGPCDADAGHAFGCVWSEPQGLVLIVHDERESRKENALEREIVESILDAYPSAPDRSVVILSPHRGQRGLLQEQLDGRPAIAAIDTVERLQGGEAPTVIVTATASDPSQIQNAEDFLMNLNRVNVAFSRAESRLIIIASQTLLDHIASDLAVYEASMLWKQVRRTCSTTIGDLTLGSHRVRILAPSDAGDVLAAPAPS